jgi:predicted methyltransferase
MSPDDELRRVYRTRVSAFIVAVILVVTILSVLLYAIQSLSRLEAVESRRNEWQRPSAILQTLNLKDWRRRSGFGSGVGYFTLKLAGIVGDRGRVLAVDIRILPLLFLQVRTFLRGQRNIIIVRSDADHPHLPQTAVHAVLIANTYHELKDSRTVLATLYRTLVSGGRLAIVDRGPRVTPLDTRDTRESEKQHHELSCAFVEAEVRQSGFEIVRRDDAFMSPPGDEVWWLLVARKP